MKSWVTQLRKGLLEFCILRVIAKGETYGYELIQNLKKLNQLAVTESTVYPILTRLKTDGYIQVRKSSSPDGPPRRYFSLTTMGQHRINEMNGYWAGLCQSISLLK